MTRHLPEGNTFSEGVCMQDSNLKGRERKSDKKNEQSVDHTCQVRQLAPGAMF